MHEPITRIISKQLDIKLGPFTQEELDSVLRKIKNRKAAGLDEIPPEVWKTRWFNDILLRHCNTIYNQNPIDRWMKGCILPFPKNGDLGLAKNYRGITLTSIAAKIYNALLWNRIEPKIDNILRKNQNGFQEIDPRHHKYWPSVESLRAYGQKTYKQHYYLLTLPRPSIPFLRKNQNGFQEIDPRHHKYWPSVESLRAYGQKTYKQHYYCWLYQDLRFHSQRKDGTNPTSIRPT